MNTNKKNLWVYGCSHSTGWVWNENHSPHTYFKPWPEIVSEGIGYNLINRAKEGSSFHNIRDKILNDIPSWNEEDLVLIQETYRVRATSPYIKDNIHIERTEQLIGISEPLDNIERINWEYFLNTLDIIKKLNKVKSYFILTDPPFGKPDERFTSNEDSFIELPNSICLNQWIRSDKRIQQMDGGTIFSGKYGGHMNQLGNERLAEIVINRLTKFR